MKIDRVTLSHVRIPLLEPFRISNGVIAEKDAIIVAVHSEGLTGYGESSPMSGSFYSEDTPESTWKELVDVILPQMRGHVFASLREVNELLEGTHTGGFARAGVETAFWDLECRRKAVPLFRCLGGTSNTVECGLAVGIVPTINHLLQEIEHHLPDGYKRLKIKIQPGWDLAPLRAIRKEHPDLPLMVDANCAYTREDLDHLQKLEVFQLMMIEQPLPKDDLVGHAQLQTRMKTPICLDEAAKDLETVKKAVELGSCQIINIKIQRVGGLHNAVAIHDYCTSVGIPVWGGTMPELGIGSAQTAHLCTLPNFTYPTDVQPSLRWFVDDLIDPYLEVEDGTIRIPSGAGNAYSLNANVLKRYLVHEESF